MHKVKKVAPFRFMTSSSLVTICGPKAFTAEELLSGIRSVSGSSIFHHSHQVYREWQAYGRPPVHDFGYWASEVLRERSLGERLSMIDPTQFTEIRAFRQALIEAMDSYLSEKPLTNRVGPGSEFVFCESTSVVIDTGIEAANLNQLVQALGLVTNRSLYYHLFEARLRLGRQDNDISLWLRQQLGEDELADEISRWDITIFTLEQIRARLLFLLGSKQGLSPLALAGTLAQMPFDIVETVVTEVLNLPVRTLKQIWRKSPGDLSRILMEEVKRIKFKRH